MNLFSQRRFKFVLIALFALVLLNGCGSQPIEDETENLPVESLLELGKAALENNRYEEAILIYKKLESRFPYGKPAEQSQLDLAYAYYKNADPELAVAATDRFIRLHPTHERVDYAHYLKGLATYKEKSGWIGRVTGTADLSNRDTRPAREAYHTYRELITRFPDSPYADDAKLRMLHMVNVLAKHDIGVARYYLSRGAFVAVVNRAKKVIEEFEQAPAVEDALGLMGVAYREMGMESLQADTRRVLEINFPDSRYLNRF
ncbi:MAG: outer membrane protein assembly factor BamD [Parasphingorhabdus sp.]|jgi:outer membrane protein assembly factor BamD